MKVVCVKEKLKEYVSQAERVAGKNISLPILNSLLLKAEDKSLVIRATNLDVGVEFTLPAKVEKPGEVAVPAKVLSGILSGLVVGKNIDLELVNDNLVVSTEKNTTLVKSFKTDDFPTIPHVENGKPLTIAVSKLTTGIRSVSYASAVSDIKPEISSVYMYHGDSEIVFVATDSFRLAEKKVKDGGVLEFEGVIVPVKNIHEIIRVFDNISSDCVVEFDTNQISFTADGVYITSRVVHGVYPDYQQIVPKNFSTEVTVVKNDVVNALKLTNIFADKFNKVNLKIDADRGVFEVNAKNTDVGENMTTIDATIKGDSFDVNFNYKYILDGFQSIHQDSVVLKYNADKDVMVIQGVSDPSFMYLVKPMNR